MAEVYPEISSSPNPQKLWLRYVVLAVVVFLNASNAILWLSFSSVCNLAADHFNVPEKDIDYFSLVFCISTVVAGLLVVWFVDKRGLRFAILVGAWLNALGALVRVLCRFWDSYGVAMTGQALAALAQPFLYCIPTKVAEQWFPDNQRAMATSLAVMANLVGQLIACGITPLFINQTSNLTIHNMNLYYSIPSFVGAIVATIFIRSSKPESAPSCSAAISTNYPFFSALKTFLSKKESILLLFGIGSVLGISYTLMSRMEEILCTRGYDNEFSGWCTMTLMGSGLLGAMLASVVADRIKSFIPIIKISLALMVVALCFFSVIVRYRNQDALILTACGLVGFWGYAAFPVGLELAVENSFTILPEATSTGLILIAGQFLSIIYFVFFETLTTDMGMANQACSKGTVVHRLLAIHHEGPDVKAEDSTYPLFVLAGTETLLVSLFIQFFKSDYNRMKTENRNMSAIINDDDPILNSASFDDGSMHTSIYS